ncbi:MAG: hypothetical protein AAF628_07700 [Planctomycetota bacterium]
MDVSDSGHRRTFVTLVTAASLAFGAHAQGSRDPHQQPPRGDHATEDALIAYAPGLRALLWPDGVEIHGLGEAGAAVRVRLALTAVRRGVGPNLFAAGETTPEVRVDHNITSYDRGVCVERYELCAEGLEQSFVFGSRLPGQGDLVIELETTGDVAGVADPPGVVFRDQGFRNQGGAGLRMGGVTAIAADGSRQSSDLELDGTVVRIRVAERFVRDAAFPLVVDPLITSLLPGPWAFPGESDLVTGGPLGDSVIMWAVEITTLRGRYATGRWQTMDASGQIVGFSHPVSAVNSGQYNCPRTAYLAGLDLFVAANNVRSRATNLPITFDAFDSRFTRGGNGFVGRQNDVVEVFDLGGESTALDDDLVVAWSREGLGTRTILATEMEIVPGQTATKLKEKVLGTADLDSYVAISKGNGQPGRHMVVWTEGGELMAAILDRQHVILDSGRLGHVGHNADVDGDGTKWMVAYRNGSGDLACLPVFWDSTEQVAYVGQERVLGGALLPNPSYWSLIFAPPQPIASVVWAGDSYLVSYLDANDNSTVASIDPFDCSDCEGSFVTFARASPRTGFEERATVPVATPHADLVSPLSDRAIVVADGTSFRFFGIEDGLNTNLGGGCGRGGYTAGSCARVGNAGFTLRLRDSRRSANAVALLGATSGMAGCGSCQFRVSLLGSVWIPALADPLGNVALPLPIPDNPALLGQALFAQWAVDRGSSCGGSFDLSDATAIVLQ